MQNRGRLASKCSLSPTSPRKRRESFRSSPAWHTEGNVDTVVSHRHFSAPDLDHFHSSSKNGVPELSSSRGSSSSTSECSEPTEENPFSPVIKRARSSSPENLDRSAAEPHRRSSESSLALLQNPGTGVRSHLPAVFIVCLMLSINILFLRFSVSQTQAKYYQNYLCKCF